MRVSKKKLESIKKKYNVNTLWSWSKYNSYKIDQFGWYLKYIKHLKETKTSIYSVSGGACHDIIERYYQKEITYDQMIEEYEAALVEMNMDELKYNRKDEKANDKIANTYENSIRHFFKNHVPIEGKVITEQFVTINVDGNIFQGYIDFINKEDDVFIITDWKTSTIYTGKKIDKERGQLVLYAESLIQKGIPLEKIKLRWNFLKYCKVTSELVSIDKETKKNKTRETNALRIEWVNKIQNNLKVWLRKEGYNEEDIEDMVLEAVSNNNLDNIPEVVRNRYKVEDSYVYIPLNQEVIDDLKKNIVETIKEIEDNQNIYNITNDEKIWWTHIDASNEFYFATLCGYSRKVHKPYDEYLKDKEMFLNKKSEEEEEDLDWLNDL
ncbi:PD-(D/E)XK nuclease family protein (plasmid) [Clostridium perfringens]|uniref:PD-(D/E)XK nuclease family protein n=1 Tax=Clostridium perfringens TaxID=1502 RepID=UPI00096A5ACD|nr:PD-(D/E)XK nuclease family protein [Clostridium perfringens]